jgi:hypothetical protein
MPTKDYQLTVAQNAVHKLSKWAYQIGVLKETAIAQERHAVAIDCETAIRGLNGLIDFYQKHIAKLEEELMVEVPIEIKKPERHLRLVKK